MVVVAPAPQVVSGNQKKYRREFNDPTLAEWDVVTGSGMTVNVSGGNLVVTTGTTTGSTTTLTAKTSFQPPFNAAFGFRISQKIAQNEFYLEMVAENSDGTLDETVVAAWRISGTDTTTTSMGRTEVRNGGASRLQSANLGSHATQTTDSFYEITIEADEVWFHSRTADATVSRAASNVRNTVAPDPNRRYRPRIRIVNGTAPASTTTLTVSAVTVVDFTEIQTSVQGGAGATAAGQGIPVVPVTGATIGLTTGNSITPIPSATQTGLSVTKLISAASTNAAFLKASAARLYGYQFHNTGAAVRYVKFYNKATAPVPGTDTPFLTVPVPAGQVVDAALPYPISFATGLGIATTTGSADNDSAAVGAGELVGYTAWI